MLSEPTLEKLKGLRFDGMAAAWNEQQQKSSDLTSLSFDERFGLLVDAEWLHRQNKRLSRYLAEAKLRLGQAPMLDRVRHRRLPGRPRACPAPRADWRASTAICASAISSWRRRSRSGG